MDPNPSRILIVEDDAVTADQYARMLRLEGYEVRIVATAEEGLDEVPSWQPEALIVDFVLPKMDGLAVLRCLRARADNRSIPVAIVTGDYFLGDAISTQLQDLHAVVAFKPLWLDDLVSLVRGLLHPVR
jgi:two-component system response regulator MprA